MLLPACSSISPAAANAGEREIGGERATGCAAAAVVLPPFRQCSNTVGAVRRTSSTSWQERQAAAIKASYERQSREQVRAEKEQARRTSSLRIARKLSLQNCSDEKLKVWALAQSLQPARGSSKSLPMRSALTMAPADAEALAKQTEACLKLPHRLCGFHATEHSTVEKMLGVVQLSPDDVFYDLGCGDGRVVAAVVRHFGCRGVGVDTCGALVRQARSRAEALFASEPELLARCSFLEEDITRMSLADACVIFIYMPRAALNTLLSTVLPRTGLRPGTLIYTNEHSVDESAMRNVKFKSSEWSANVHCYEWSYSSR
eukprot:TRINITY_DN46158_c0_g1_i1.p1 TRINITY_DN46158_c0_g1~~TRINITY_DN46158_c0_g1_i1.p1  ORF type:complete len:317 (+),score=61.87 TRINITY_DN46158_c0_g1_i1:26-976(+)